MAARTLLPSLAVAAAAGLGLGLGVAPGPAVARTRPVVAPRSTRVRSGARPAGAAARPIVLRKLDVRMLLLWRYDGDLTRLRAVREVRAPHDTLIAVNCLGPRCPRLPDVPIYRGSLDRLWRALKRVQFHSGQTLVLSCTQRHRRAELIYLKFRRGRAPGATIHYL